MARHDSHGRRITAGPLQWIFMGIVTLPLLAIVVLSLLIWPPPKRWADPRYRW